MTENREISDRTKEFFAHYGVPGMRWGHRRNRGPDGTVTRKKIVSAEAGKLTKASTKRKDLPLTDTQLRQKINRMQMEQQYSQLKAQQATKGRNFVAEMLKTSGRQVAQQTTTRIMQAAVNAALKNAAAKTGNASTAALLNEIAGVKKKDKKD